MHPLSFTALCPEQPGVTQPELAAVSSVRVEGWPCHGGLGSSGRSEKLGHPTAVGLWHMFVGSCLRELSVFGDVEQFQRHTQWSLSGPGSALTSWISSFPIQLLPAEWCQSFLSPLSSSNDFLLQQKPFLFLLCSFSKNGCVADVCSEIPQSSIYSSSSLKLKSFCFCNL